MYVLSTTVVVRDVLEHARASCLSTTVVVRDVLEHARGDEP